MFRILARNTVVNSAALAIRVGVSLALTSFLVGRLGNQRYGLWTLALTFTVSGALSLFSLGFQGALVKYVAQYHAQKLSFRLNETISATLFVYSASAAIGCVLVLAFAKWLVAGVFHVPEASQPAVRLAVSLFGVQLLFELPAMAADAILEGLQRYDVRSAIDILKSLCFAAGAVLFVRSADPVVALAQLQVGCTVFGGLIVWLSARRLLPEWRLVRPGRAVVREMFGFTNDLLVLRINGIVYNNMDKWIIGASLATSAVAEYDIANRVHGLAAMVMSLASSAVVPAASALDATDSRQQLRNLMVRGTKYTLALTLPVVCAIAVLARPLLAHWISPAHASLSIYVQLFMAYLLFWAMTPVYWNMLVGVKETRPMVRIQLVSVALNLILTVVLVRRVGLAGAMLGTLAGNALAFVPYTRLALTRFDVAAGELLRGAVFTTYPQAALAGAALFALVRFRPPASLLEDALYGAFCIGVFLAAFVLTGLDDVERKAIAGAVAGGVRSKGLVLRHRVSEP
jgi:O-antigen/teichoic acid export membrane protein